VFRHAAAEHHARTDRHRLFTAEHIRPAVIHKLAHTEQVHAEVADPRVVSVAKALGDEVLERSALCGSVGEICAGSEERHERRDPTGAGLTRH